MSELRWILIGFTLVLLAAIYLWGRRRSSAAAAREDALRSRPEPSLHPRDVHAEGERAAELDISQTAPVSAAGPVAERGREASAARRSADQDDLPESAEHGARAMPQDSSRARLEPTFSDAEPTQELPVHPESAALAPTLSSSEIPAPRRIERRKILSLRLCALPQRIEGAKLLESLLAESLEHGKYDVFHRLHDDGTALFSVASMVEPGTFDLEKIAETQYPGVTLFAQLPGPVPGMHALNELVACARRLQQALGGTLQDERGVPLTVHRIERMRQEVREFERPPAGSRGGSAAQPAHP